jgi:receptor protein-tyrosine kinase
MSIVERALQKAQAKARADNPPPPDVATEPAVQVAPAEVPPVQPFSHTSKASADNLNASLTSRDLKAMVHLDFDRLREAGRLPTQDRAVQTEEEIRRIKWPLLRSIAGGDGVQLARNNVIQVTSALPGEGKTFTSLNLALSIVRDREMRVVLVDGDVARPGLTPTMGLDGRPGLVDALENPAMDPADITYQTDVDGLFFVPAGKWHPHSPEFLAGSRMPELIQALSRRVGNGVIILDSPPLLSTNEAQVATRCVGQVLMVVHADRTEQQAVLDALALIDKSVPVSAVLNRVESSALSRYYGHYYYGYGEGGYGRTGAAGKGNA